MLKLLLSIEVVLTDLQDSILHVNTTVHYSEETQINCSPLPTTTELIHGYVLKTINQLNVQNYAETADSMMGGLHNPGPMVQALDRLIAAPSGNRSHPVRQTSKNPPA